MVAILPLLLHHQPHTERERQRDRESLWCAYVNGGKCLIGSIQAECITVVLTPSLFFFQRMKKSNVFLFKRTELLCLISRNLRHKSHFVMSRKQKRVMYLLRYASVFGRGTKVWSQTAQDKSKPRYRDICSPFTQCWRAAQNVLQSFAAQLLLRAATSQSQCHKEKHSVNLAKAKQMADHRARSAITKQRISMTNAKMWHAL